MSNTSFLLVAQKYSCWQPQILVHGNTDRQASRADYKMSHDGQCKLLSSIT